MLSKISEILIIHNSPLLNHLCNSNSVGSRRISRRRINKAMIYSKSTFTKYIIRFDAIMDPDYFFI